MSEMPLQVVATQERVLKLTLLQCVGYFLEPSCGRSSSKVDKIFQDRLLTEVRRAWRGAGGGDAGAGVEADRLLRAQGYLAHTKLPPPPRTTVGL